MGLLSRLSLHSVLFLVLALVLGFNYVWAKIGLNHMGAPEVVFLRVVFGLLPLAAIGFWRRELAWAHWRHWPHLVVLSLLTATLYYLFFKWGIARLGSGIAGAISGATPLVAFVGTALFLRDEVISRGKVLGLVLGVIGIIVLAQPWASWGEDGARDPLGVLAVLGASVCMGVAFVYSRRFVAPLAIPSVSLVTYSLALSLVMVAPFTDFGLIAATSGKVGVMLAVIIGSGVLGTGLAVYIYHELVRQWGAIPASSSTLPPPVVGLALGWLVLREDIGLADVFATGLILAGVVLLRRD